MKNTGDEYEPSVQALQLLEGLAALFSKNMQQTASQAPEEEYTPKTQALEALVRDLENKGMKDPDEITETLHATSLLSSLRSAYSILADETRNIAYFRLSYDPSSNHTDFQLLNGKSRHRKKGCVDVTKFNLITAALITDKLPILFEGITGIGKTFEIEKYARTILPPRSYDIRRLSHNMTNVLQAYIRPEIKNGMPVMRLDRNALRQIAFLFIDEKNRAPSGPVLALMDSEVRLPTGEGGIAGPYVPQIRKDPATGRMIVECSEDFLKKLTVLSAQNPARSDNARYTETFSTDEATANRDLTLTAPNPLIGNRSSINLVAERNGHHKRFIDSWISNMEGYLGGPMPELRQHLVASKGTDADTADSEWLSIYGFTFDGQKTKKQTLKSALELNECMLEILLARESGRTDFKRLFDTETIDITDADEILKGYNARFSYSTVFSDNTERMKRAADVVNSFSEDFVPRDSGKAKKLADALATHIDIMRALETQDPVSTFKQRQPYITIEHVSYAHAIILSDKKQQSSKANPIELVNCVASEYLSLLEKFISEMKAKIEIKNDEPSVGIRNIALLYALDSVKDLSAKDKPEAYAKKMIESINNSAQRLSTLDEGSDMKKLFIAGAVADLSTLAVFIDQYKEGVSRCLLSATDRDKGMQKMRQFQAFGDYFIEKRRDLVSPTIYEERLTRLFAK